MPSNENLFLDAFGGESRKQAREVNQGVQYLSSAERTKLFQDGFGCKDLRVIGVKGGNSRSADAGEHLVYGI